MKTVVTHLPGKRWRLWETARNSFGWPFKLLGCGLVLTLLSGCAHSRNPGVVYYAPPGPPPPSAAAPPVERPNPGSYRAPQIPAPLRVVPTPELVPTPAPVPGVLSADAAVAASVSQVLLTDSERNGLWTRVEATIENGVVTLRGVVPSEHERFELVDRISKLAGVAAVKDRLERSNAR